MIRILRYAILSFIAAVASAQVADNNFNAFKDVVPSAQINISNLLIHASHYRTVEIDLNKLRNKLIGVPYRNNSSSNSSTIISLPLPDGSMHSYRVLQNNTMHPDLAAQFPAIKSYDGYGLGKSKEFVKFDITPLGFHAMILSPGKSPIFIDPLNKDNPKYLMVYFRRDYITHKTMNTNANDVVYGLNYLKNSASYNDFSSCYLRHYRLALAATAEYTHYFGGTVGQALAAQVITMNRVNGVYEAEIAVTMQIISNNNALIYTNPTSQPYTSGNATAMIGQNQINIDEVIGTNNYDVGHVFDQNIQNSGLASLGSVCDPLTKAQGVTGSKAPVGDPFDIDFVSHEMGHQFGANHTQNNNCNRHDPTAVEPGSGSTIMGYAGI
ncbi:MAG: M12 family metallo-peptidase, partial [bacterium]|nr:M12 family metallo-peptidase [bacterium]